MDIEDHYATPSLGELLQQVGVPLSFPLGACLVQFITRIIIDQDERDDAVGDRRAPKRNK